MRLKPTKGTILTLSVLLGVVLLGTGGLFWLQRGWLAQTTQQLQEKELELHDGQRIARRRDEARASLEADRALIANLEPGVSNAAYVPTLLKQLEQLASTTKNRVIGVRPQMSTQGPTKLEQRRDPDAQSKEGGSDKKAEKKVEEPYTRLEIEVNLEGRFASVQSFVDQLMRFPKIVAVEQLSLKPKTGDDHPAGTLEVQLKVTAFIMKGEQPLNLPAAREVASADLGGIH